MALVKEALLPGGGVRAAPDCIPCLFKQVLSAARKVTDDQWLQVKVLKQASGDLLSFEMDRTPASISFDALQRASKLLGTQDPFAKDRSADTAAAIEILPTVEKMLDQSSDRFRTAVMLAVAGNIIDTGILSKFDLAAEVEKAADEEPGIDDVEELRQAVKAAEKVFYILDNAGEAVFDRILMREMKRMRRATSVVAEQDAKDSEKMLSSPPKIVCAVRHTAIINDALRQDAEASGIGELAEIITPGAPMLGVELPRVSTRFKAEFDSADLVISKGQANLETLLGCKRTVFFILRAKCEVIANVLGVKLGRAVIARVGSEV